MKRCKDYRKSEIWSKCIEMNLFDLEKQLEGMKTSMNGVYLLSYIIIERLLKKQKSSNVVSILLSENCIFSRNSLHFFFLCLSFLGCLYSLSAVLYRLLTQSCDSLIEHVCTYPWHHSAC